MVRLPVSMCVALAIVGCGGTIGNLGGDDGGAQGGGANGGGSSVGTGGGSASLGGGTSSGGGAATGGGSSAATGGGTSAGGGTGLGGGSAIDSGLPDAGATELVHFIGRFDTTDSAGPRFAFPGSQISARFSGTGVGVMLEDQGNNQFDVSIDGAAPTLLKTQGAVSKSLATGLLAGEHTVSLIKRTESNQGIVQFKGFMPVGGALVASPFPFARVIEFVGDSITCGYGNLGVGPSCSFSADTEDENVAWGALTAQQLDAMHVVVAYSGRGMYRNYGGGMTDLMPQVWTRTFADDSSSTWDFTGYDADVVVINLGTNDYSVGDPGVPFETAYSTFLVSVRMAYPRAFIVCTIGTMTDDASYKTHVQNAMTSSGVTKVSLLDLGAQDGTHDGLGCDYHPSTTTHVKMAAKLVAHIKTLLPW